MSRLWDALRRAEKERAELPEDAEKVPQACLTGCRKTLTFPAEHALGCPNTGKNELIISSPAPPIEGPFNSRMLLENLEAKLGRLDTDLQRLCQIWNQCALDFNANARGMKEQLDMIERKLDVLLIPPAKQKRKARK